MKFKPHHIAFTVGNLEESIAWYKEKLGFEIVHKYFKNGWQIALMKLDDVQIELFGFDKTNPLPEHSKDLMSDLHTVGTKHLCIEVEDLNEIIQDLKAKGVEFVTEIDTASFGGRYTFFKDCNGILIELYQK